jgi:multisubunit Na+/H+ antiporter MnhG subunit
MVIVILVWLTMPIASHALARAAMRESSSDDEATHAEVQ